MKGDDGLQGDTWNWPGQVPLSRYKEEENFNISMLIQCTVMLSWSDSLSQGAVILIR